MNKLSLTLILLFLCSLTGISQNKKFDKTLRKIDSYYASGNFLKASSSLAKLKSSAVSKLGRTNPYMPGLALREAKIKLAMGMLTDFDATLTSAMNEAASAFGDNSNAYANTLIEVAAMYNEYGNYRIAREYIRKAEDVLGKTADIEKPTKAKLDLIEAEAMIGQGFYRDAIALLTPYEEYYLSRAVEKESIVENGQIVSKRVPENELFERFNQYATYKTLLGMAYGDMGRAAVTGASAEDPDVDFVFQELKSWFKGKNRFMGETSLAEVRYQYIWNRILVEYFQGEGSLKQYSFAENLSDLKKRTTPSNALAHEIYLSYLRELLRSEQYSKYLNVRLEYERMIEKNYPKTSVHRANLNAVEFNAKLARDKTRNLENQALGVLASKSLPENYKTNTLILNFLFEVALTEKKYANAEKYLQQVADVQRELCGEESPKHHLARLALANFYLDYTNKIDEAGKIYEESYFKIVEPQIGDQHKQKLPILNHIAQWYELKDQFEAASKTLKKAEHALRVTYEPSNILYAGELNHIAKLQLKLGEYEQAERNLNEALKVVDMKQNRALKEYKPTYIGLLETQAKLYAIKGMFDEADANLSRSKKIIDKSDGDLGESLSTSEELTSLLIMLGKYSAAEKLLQEQIPAYEKLYGAQSVRLIEPLVNRSRILLARGEYTEAERTALRANRIATQTYSDISTQTAPTQQSLSDIYAKLGDFEKAEEQITKALTSQEKQFGRNHIEVAKSLSHLALIKFHKGDNKKVVEKLLLESRKIMEDKLGKDNPQYAEVLKNVAVLYISEKKFDIAFNSLTVAESIWAAKTGRKNNINLASIYTLTGDVYYQSKNYRKAEEFYLKSKSLYEKFFSTSHPEYVRILSKMSKVYYMQKDYKRSKRNIEEALGNYENFIKTFFPALSEAEKAKFWNTIKYDFEFYNTLAFSNLDDFKDLTGKVYNYQLLTKALLLSSSIKIRERIMNSTDQGLKNQYNEWVEKKEALTLALSMSPDQLLESGIDPAQLRQDIEELEKELSRKSELFGQSFDTKRITFEDVRKSLQSNEVAIEMVRYRHFDHHLTDSVVYAALYITPDLSRPRVITFPNGKHMETRFFKYYRNCITGKIPDQYSYSVFWQPIQDVIAKSSTIYLSADGVYNQINLEAIPTPDGKYIIDNSNVILVSNTKDLYLRKVKTRPSSSDKTASIFGNPRFYATARGKNSIPQLPGTEREVSQIDFMLKQKGYSTATYVEETATEERIKELNNPKIFHIATHGFYKANDEIADEDDLEPNEAQLARNPLLRTGLLLRGAGDVMEKTQFNYNIENGILTAYEAMSLNLDKTDLVVLSACETGLGEVEAGEGVYGLQRAFLNAGAKLLIMSMFKVDDAATEKLMLYFYQKYLNSGKWRESFTEAKKQLRTEYPEPIYWGAIMMIGLE